MDGVGLRDRMAEAMEARRKRAEDPAVGDGAEQSTVLSAMGWAVDALFDVVREVPRDALPTVQDAKDAAASLYRTHIEPIDLPYVPNRVVEPAVDRVLMSAFVSFVGSGYGKFLETMDEDDVEPGVMAGGQHVKGGSGFTSPDSLIRSSPKDKDSVS